MDQSDDLRIDRLSSADAVQLYRFYAALEPEVVWFYEPYGSSPPRAKIDEVLAPVDAGRDVAFGLKRPDGTILGHVFITELAGEMPTFGIGIAACLHGRGWGRQLAETALAEADGAGAPLVTLTVVKANTRAQSLYRSLGFDIVGECTFRTECDSYVMHRRRA